MPITRKPPGHFRREPNGVVWTLVGGAATLVTMVVVLAVAGGFGSGEMADGAELGEISVTELSGDTQEIAVVGTGSSGHLFCDRLTADGRVEDNSYVIEVSRLPIAFGCNDDARAIRVRIEVSDETLDQVDDIQAIQNGTPFGYLSLRRES